MIVPARNRLIAVLCFVQLAVASCAPGGYLKPGSIEELNLGDVVPDIPSGKDLLLKGKLRIDLPDFRLRGVVRLVFSDRGNLRMDFHHSSIMGAYEEDFSLLIRGEEFYIFDRKRDRLYEGERALEIVNGKSVVDIREDDLLYILLVKGFKSTDLENPRYLTNGSEWLIRAVFRGRDIELGGSKIGRVDFLNQCLENRCYNVRYGDYRRFESGFYPFFIKVSESRGEARASLELKELDVVEHDPGYFSLRSMLFSLGEKRCTAGLACCASLPAVNLF